MPSFQRHPESKGWGRNSEPGTLTGTGALPTILHCHSLKGTLCQAVFTHITSFNSCLVRQVLFPYYR